MGDDRVRMICLVLNFALERENDLCSQLWYFLLMNKRGLTLNCGIFLQEIRFVAPYRFLQLLRLTIDPKKVKKPHRLEVYLLAQR